MSDPKTLSKPPNSEDTNGRGKNPKYYLDNDSRALAGRASLALHNLIDTACIELGIDKATFVRLAARFLLQHLSDGKGNYVPDLEVESEIPYCRSAMDVHKGL